MLISCVAYKDGRKVADISVDEIHRYVSQPDCLVDIYLFYRLRTAKWL